MTNHIHRNINAPPLILLTDLQNCTTIGFAGSEAKVAWLKELGYTHAFNYKTCNLGEVLKTAAPEGANVYIDHVSVPSIITIKFHGLFFHVMIGDFAGVSAAILDDVVGSIKCYEIIESLRNFRRNMFNITSNIVLANGLAPIGVRILAG